MLESDWLTSILIIFRETHAVSEIAHSFTNPYKVHYIVYKKRFQTQL